MDSLEETKYLQQKQLFITSREMDRNIVPIKNKLDWAKPDNQTGLWTSTYQQETHDSEWVEWCIYNNWCDVEQKRWFLLTPSKTARIYTIDSLRDFKRALKLYRSTPYLNYEIFAHLDYEAISRDYDAIHLTSPGQQETRLSVPNLYGWDVESTLWFRWCFDEVQEISHVPNSL